MTKLIVVTLVALLGLALAHVHNLAEDDGFRRGNGHAYGSQNYNHGYTGPKPDYFYRFTGNETINGVAPEIRLKWMRFAMQTRLSKSPCPFDAFGAVIVNRTSDTLVCATFGSRSNTDPTSHAEIALIRNCSSFYPGKAYDKSVWQQLSLYTTGESCPMCMAATRWAGIGENIYATTINRLYEYGWTQIMISSLQVDIKSVDGNITPPTILIANVIPDEIDPYFAWQYNSTNPCPGGCVRTATGSCGVPVPV